MLYQRTLAKKVKVTGIGIHSGKKVTMTLHPAEADFGIQFKRTDLLDAPLLKADAQTVGATENNTTIGSGENAVHTVEHLLSCFYGLGINNVLCEIDGPEVPIMDGSGASFVFLLKETGIATLNKSKKFLVVLEKIKVVISGRPLSRLQSSLSILPLFLLTQLLKNKEKYSSFHVKTILKKLAVPEPLVFCVMLICSREKVLLRADPLITQSF